jgi:outer membrane protein OmpA-like peptidoglycan-associated protein
VQNINRTVLLILGSALLSGCSSLSHLSDSMFGGEGGGRTVVYSSGGQAAPAAADEPDINMTYPEMAREVSNSAVQVFPLDAPAPVANAAPRSAGSGGVPSRTDSNVVVFPFGDQGAMQNSMPDMQPLSQTDYPSPFADSGILAAPTDVQSQPQAIPLYTAPGPQASNNLPVIRDAAPIGPGNSVYFRHGSSSLNAGERQSLRRIAQDYKSSGSGTLVVAGHASARAEPNDPTQRHLVNLKVSMNRAYSVSRELIHDGVPAGAIDTRAYGDTRPSGSEATSRRVEVSSTSGTYY